MEYPPQDELLSDLSGFVFSTNECKVIEKIEGNDVEQWDLRTPGQWTTWFTNRGLCESEISHSNGASNPANVKEGSTKIGNIPPTEPHGLGTESLTKSSKQPKNVIFVGTQDADSEGHAKSSAHSRNVFSTSDEIYGGRMAARNSRKGDAGDLAFSATHFPDARLTLAIIFGCSGAQRKDFMSRINRLPTPMLRHPFSLYGTFAELERQRLKDFTRDLESKSLLIAENIVNSQTHESQWLSAHTRNQQDAHMLYDDLEAAKAQLRRACDALDLHANGQTDNTTKELKTTFQRFIDEYESRIRSCLFAKDLLETSSQKAFNVITRHDSIQMKAIAILGMVYLPVSTTAAIFNLKAFQWTTEDGKLAKLEISESWWVPSLTGLLLMGVTLLVGLGWEGFRRWWKGRRADNASLG
ncbi:hypothetical protein F5Y15DRAFT_428597 [Xylariaceae sp. FL0016]|nr:hypothetical protein F5Y15DRAFT_428597 [Xylariaceae sp. FL0016]